MIMQDR